MGGEQCAITAICTCFDKGVVSSSPSGLSGDSLQYLQRVMRMPVGPRATVQFHVCAATSELSGLLNQLHSVAEPAPLTHITPIVSVCLYWTKYALAGRWEEWGCIHGSAFHTSPTFKRSSEVRHELLRQSPQVTKKQRRDPKSLHLKQTMFQGPAKAGMIGVFFLFFTIKLCPGASLCLERH